MVLTTATRPFVGSMPYRADKHLVEVRLYMLTVSLLCIQTDDERQSSRYLCGVTAAIDLMFGEYALTKDYRMQSEC